MADYTKKPLNRSLIETAENAAARALSQQGKALPCSVAKVISSGVVEVNFEVTSQWSLPRVIVPVAAPTYIRYPIQVGDLGMVFSADAALGGVTGLGGGLADLASQPGNLSALVFVWLGNKNWPAALDPNALELWRNITLSPTALGFFGQGKTTKKTVSGALSAVSDPAAKAVLTSLIQALAAYGLITNGTT